MSRIYRKNFDIVIKCNRMTITQPFLKGFLKGKIGFNLPGTLYWNSSQRQQGRYESWLSFPYPLDSGISFMKLKEQEDCVNKWEIHGEGEWDISVAVQLWQGWAWHGADL